MTHRYSSRSTSGRALCQLIAASALVALAPTLARAQSEAPDCVALVAEMLTPTPSTGVIRASAGCPVSGPVTLGNRWTRRGLRGSGERTALVETSALMRDARLYEAVSAVVRDASYPLADRMAGLRVLVGYADEGTGVIQQGAVYGARAAELSGGRQSEATATVAGSTALPPSVSDDIRRELARIAREDRDPSMRYAAKREIEKLR